MIRTYPIMSIIVADKILFAKENEVDMYRSANAMNAESLTGWHSIFLTDSSSIYMYRQCIWVNDHLDEDSLRSCVSALLNIAVAAHVWHLILRLRNQQSENMRKENLS